MRSPPSRRAKIDDWLDFAKVGPCTALSAAAVRLRLTRHTATTRPLGARRRKTAASPQRPPHMQAIGDTEQQHINPNSLPPPVPAPTAAPIARKNSTDDLAAEVSQSPPVHTPSDARLLYREWRTGSHVGADLARLETGELNSNSSSSSMSSEDVLSRSPFGVYGRSPNSLPRIAERLENVPLRANVPPAAPVPSQDVDARARLLSQKIVAMDAAESGGAAEAIKPQSGSYGSVGPSEPATGIKKAQSYQALADLEKKGYFPVAPKPSALGVQRGLKDSVVNDMCRAVVKHMVGDVYVSASGSYGQRKVLNHLYEPVFASVQAHFRRLPARYALSVNPDDVPLHMRLLAQNQRDPTAIAVNAQLKKDDNGEIVPNVCEVVVVSLDRENILDAITRALTTMKGNILDADVMTTADGTLLDRFVVKGSFMSDERQDELRTNIEQNLRRLSMDEEARPSTASSQEIASNENVSLAEKLGVLQMVDKNEIKAEWKLDLNEVRLEKAVGSGRSGSTYSAWWRGTHVAAKVVDSSTNTQAVGEELLNEFHREVAVVSKLRHPNIVLFLGAAINPPRYCLVFEFMENGTLTDLIRARRGPIDFFRLAAEMAMGMNYLHLCSIMHRDLKSGNVLIDSHGTAKISDFGLSCVLEIGSSSDLTAETGTYRWMAPEVIRHEPYSNKADVYSFGIVLWELLARDQPFRGLTPIQAAFAVARQQMRPALPRQTPQKIGELIEHCWHHDPSRRPDFGAILEALPLVKKSLKKRDFKNMGILYVAP
ncbi:Serine/threonine-protein kinase STY17 [Phytophthora citrophthora]|uniref:Serine/threonine-protein kinase STY17 n=1 Tax=Phytophthora citrophthora TaxID=4793 RepID=A0AAD9GU65_9STRA|nr:Serine/threonine-protein kinase STY17 [Phytophthora citrophthora]